MSVASFKPEVFEEVLITEFRSNSIAEVITTPPTRVEGYKAVFNSVAGGTISDYTGTINYEEATTTPIELVFDKKKVVALAIDDVDAVQAAGDVLGQLLADKSLEMAEVQNGIVLNQIVAGTKAGNKIGTSGAPKAVDATNAYDLVVDLGVKLSKHKVPRSNRYLIASDEFVQLMAKDPRFVNNFNVLPNGVVEGVSVSGFTIIINEEVPAGTVVAVHKSATGYAMQLDKTEALRLESSFSDAVRTLQVSGVTTLRDNASAVLYYSLKAE